MDLPHGQQELYCQLLEDRGVNLVYFDKYLCSNSDLKDVRTYAEPYRVDLERLL